MKYDNGSKTGVSCFEDGSKNHKPGTADALHKLEKKKIDSPLKEQNTTHTLISVW